MVKSCEIVPISVPARCLFSNQDSPTHIFPRNVVGQIALKKKLEHHQGEILLGKRLGVTLVASIITWALSHDARLSCQAKHLNLQSSLDG